MGRPSIYGVLPQDDRRAARLPGDPSCRVRAAEASSRGSRSRRDAPSRRAPLSRRKGGPRQRQRARRRPRHPRNRLSHRSQRLHVPRPGAALEDPPEGLVAEAPSSSSSSVPRLYFVGAPAAASLGPGFRFVSHTGFAAKAIARNVLRDTTPCASVGRQFERGPVRRLGHRGGSVRPARRARGYGRPSGIDSLRHGT